VTPCKLGHIFETTGRFCKYILKEWNRLSFYFKSTDIIQLVDETQETKKKVEKEVTRSEAGIGDSPNP
jgi:hypothetical protein